MDWRESPAELERARAEQPLLIPSPHGVLFGLFTPPAPAVVDTGTCVVMFTRPRSHRNRMFVELARRLAARGYSCFRFDYHGTGDSEGASGFLDPGRPYRDDAVAVLRGLRAARGVSRFVLVGSCFDARTALSTFMDEAAAIDGIAFIAAPVMELDTMVKAHADRKDWRHLGRALLSAENWRALGERGRWRHMTTVFSRVARRSLPGAPDESLALSPSFVEHFRALTRSRARALFLYGRDDAEHPSFEVAERTVFARLDPAARARFEIETWPGTLHGFLDVERQRRALDRITTFVESVRGGAAVAPTFTRPAASEEATWTSA